MAEPTPNPSPDPKPAPDPKPDPAAELAALREENARLKAEMDSKNKDESDLHQKAKDKRHSEERDAAHIKRIENALKFDLNSKEFIKQNESLLPKEVKDVFTQAEKEKFNDAIEKDAAIKSGIIQSFFSVQANVDLLTGSQKVQLDEYLKLTKNGKQDKAAAMYDMIFEPAFEMLKRIKKAEALSRGGHAASTDVEEAYKNKLMAGSKKHYFGEKNA